MVLWKLWKAPRQQRCRIRSSVVRLPRTVPESTYCSAGPKVVCVASSLGPAAFCLRRPCERMPTGALTTTGGLPGEAPYVIFRGSWKQVVWPGQTLVGAASDGQAGASATISIRLPRLPPANRRSSHLAQSTQHSPPGECRFKPREIGVPVTCYPEIGGGHHEGL